MRGARKLLLCSDYDNWRSSCSHQLSCRLFSSGTRPSHLLTLSNFKPTTITVTRVVSPLTDDKHTLVIVGFLSEVAPSACAFYTTIEQDSAEDVAKGIAAAINNASIPGVTAIQNKDIVSFGAGLPPVAFFAGTFGPSKTATSQVVVFP